MMELVKFNDGSFGIRKGSISYKYRDLRFPGNWWSVESMFFTNCKGSRERCEELMDDHIVINRYGETGVIDND